MNYSDNIDYDLMEKKERAKRNLQWFLGVGAIGAIILMVSFTRENINAAFQENIIGGIAAIIIGFLILVCVLGSIPIGIRLIFKVIMPCNFYTFGICVMVGYVVGLFVTPFIVIRDIYYLAKKY